MTQLNTITRLCYSRCRISPNILNMMMDNTSSSLKYSKDIKTVAIGVRDLQERILTETYEIKNQIDIQTQGSMKTSTLHRLI
jgi:hypothetical protein